MLDVLPLIILLLIGIIVLFFIFLNKQVNEMNENYNQEITKIKIELEEVETINLQLRDELLNLTLLYVEDRENLESLVMKENEEKEIELQIADEEKLQQLLKTKEKLIAQVEVFRQELMGLKLIEDRQLRGQKKREISSGMKNVREQIIEYQVLEKEIISNIINRKKHI